MERGRIEASRGQRAKEEERSEEEKKKAKMSG